MNHKVVVIDANVAIKMFHKEKDTETAKALFRSCIENETRILVPDLFLYEVMHVCERYQVAVADVLRFYDSLKSSILTSVTPNAEMWKKAEMISKDGHPKSGYPALYDSIYHALALEADAVFITADGPHHTKAHKHGGIQLLKDWGKEQQGK